MLKSVLSLLKNFNKKKECSSLVKGLVLIIVFNFKFCYAIGQIQSEFNFKYKLYTTENGLSHNFTRKCVMDKKGYLWILTLNGISKFDGLNFKNYTHEFGNSNSLIDNNPSDFALDNNADLWIAFKEHLYQLEVSKNIFKEILYNKKPLGIVKLVFDSSSNNIFCVNMNGYYRINTSNLKLAYTPFKEIQSKEVDLMGEVFLDSKKRLWIPYFRSGYHCINTNNNLQFLNKVEIWPLSFTEVSNGDIYMNCWMQPLIKVITNDTNHLLEEYHYPMNFYYTSIIYHSAVATKLTGDSILWLNNTSNGLWLFNTKSKKYTAIKYNDEYVNGLPEKEPNYFYEDKFGNFWMCTWGGLVKVNPNEQQFQSRVLKMLDFRLYNLISGIVDDPFDKSITWVSIHGAGIFKLNKNNNEIIDKYFYELTKTNNPNEDINYDRRWLKHMIIANDKTIWSPTYGGLVKVKNGTVSFVDIRYNGRICYLNHATEVNDTSIVLSSDIGSLILNPKTGVHKYLKLNMDINGKSKDYTTITSAKIDDEHVVIGGNDGLQFYDLVKHKITPVNLDLKDADSLKLNKVSCIVKCNEKLYLGSLAGLVEYDLNTKEYKLIGRSSNIDAIYENSMILDKNKKIWIYTIHDLFCYDTKSKKIFTYTKKDGIYNLANDGNVIFEYNNKFYIGFRKSFTEFDPIKLEQSNQKNEPQIDNVFVNGVEQHIDFDNYSTNYYPLEYKQNEVQFNFTSLDYTFTDKLNFEVMLEGFDENWRGLGTKRMITYNNLKPGKYIFKVKSSTGAGFWNSNYKKFSFYIQPAIWQTTWFILSIILLLVLGSIYLVRQRIKNIRLKANTKLIMTELEMQSFRSQMNPHFIFNSLHSIHNYIWQNKQEDASEYLVKFSKLIRRILELSSEKTILLSQEIETLKLYIELEHRRVDAKFNYTIHTQKLSDDLNKILVPPLIYQPFVENSIWHGLNNLVDNKGDLQIEFSLENKYLLCVITDNGIGRAKAKAMQKESDNKKKSLGIEITEKRIRQYANQIQSPIEIIDNPIGTTVKIKLNLIYE